MSSKKRISTSRIFSPGTCLHVFRVRRGDAYFTFCLLYFLVNFCLLFCVQVVGPTNELVEAKLQLKVETQRIFSQMTLKASALRSALTRLSIFVFACPNYFASQHPPGRSVFVVHTVRAALHHLCMVFTLLVQFVRHQRKPQNENKKIDTKGSPDCCCLNVGQLRLASNDRPRKGVDGGMGGGVVQPVGRPNREENRHVVLQLLSSAFVLCLPARSTAQVMPRAITPHTPLHRNPPYSTMPLGELSSQLQHLEIDPSPQLPAFYSAACWVVVAAEATATAAAALQQRQQFESLRYAPA